jgi:hypothetical protein
MASLAEPAAPLWRLQNLFGKAIGHFQGLSKGRIDEIGPWHRALWMNAK